MPNPSYTYTLTNGTNADADQVQQNFADILAGVTDGTKDMSVNAFTAAGNATLTGGTLTLGNSLSDDLVVGASLSGSLNLKTTFTSDLGTSTIGLRDVYFGDAGSAARTTKIRGATVASSWTFTLPISGGTTGMFLKTNGSGTSSWAYTDVTAGAQTATYAATGAETFIPCSGSAFTVTLPAISSFPGKRYIIIKTDSTLANIITIARSGSDTFTHNTTGLTSLALHTQGQSIELVNDGTSIWYVVNHKIPAIWTTYPLTPTASVNPSKGTIVKDEARWRRVGDSIYIHYDYHQSAAGSAGTGTYTFPFPTDVPALDTAKISNDTNGDLADVGIGWSSDGSTKNTCHVRLIGTAGVILVAQSAIGTMSNVASTYAGLNNTVAKYTFMAGPIPITGWLG